MTLSSYSVYIYILLSDFSFFIEQIISFIFSSHFS